MNSVDVTQLYTMVHESWQLILFATYIQCTKTVANVNAILIAVVKMLFDIPVVLHN